MALLIQPFPPIHRHCGKVGRQVRRQARSGETQDRHGLGQVRAVDEVIHAGTQRRHRAQLRQRVEHALGRIPGQGKGNLFDGAGRRPAAQVQRRLAAAEFVFEARVSRFGAMIRKAIGRSLLPSG
jgi:hypothetical protein